MCRLWLFVGLCATLALYATDFKVEKTDSAPPEDVSQAIRDVIGSGVYTLRYGIEPRDGNHMGGSIYRDFLLLIPAAQDKDVDVAWSADELYLQSYGPTGQPHPAVLALFPVYDEITEPQNIMNDRDQPTLAVKLGSLTLGLVIPGHGEL
jgi:hypothetical protein